VTEVFLNLTEVFHTLTGFSVLFPQLYGKCQGKTRKDGPRTALYHISLYLCCSDVIICVVRLFVLFYVVFVCKCVLPPGDNPIAVNKYIISFINSNGNSGCKVQSERLDTEYTPVVTTFHSFVHNVSFVVSLGSAALSHRKFVFSVP
jgi:hypothetical protein